MRFPHWLLAAFGCASITSHLHGAETVDYEGARYHLYRVDRADWPRLQLAWLDENDKPLGDLNGLRTQLNSRKKQIVFATNAGIFERGPKPCGLTICAGRELVPLSLRDGEGNFYLKPNGVFYLDDQTGPGVMEAEEFEKSGLKPRLATQSGPLMVRNGVIHPAFNVNSPNRRLRNAVGVRKKDGQIIFAMSDRDDSVKGRVTSHQLTRFFLHLGCQDALYLDGDISSMLVDPKPDAVLTPNTFAAMFFVAE
ncbi:phosphodiester glycosidase family protein [Prosthecobacter sp.]|uniref:phosphodiester glycosidase family protein n=1 Tax=Prosthecobacter sp. TaxID=1965333 RepID=UPI001DF2D19F|nr:phosphodiester glycosidase family protein [Prosthecobacter sp.]MCB1277475.1 phosphodiester glycosidase family protein [Prosthecobacter sp.]